MSSAYCMTCNDQVLDLAGSCPEGHPIGADDTGPEPWVGHADASGRSAPTPPPPATRPIAEVSHANSNGHAEPAQPVAQVTSFTPSDVDEMGGRAVQRAPANGEAADELAAMLASALAGSPSDTLPATSHAPAADTGTDDDLDGPWVGSTQTDKPADNSGAALPWTDADLDDFSTGAASDDPAADTTSPTDSGAAASDSNWGDLASLAAELQLDGPEASTPDVPEVTPPPAPEAPLPASDSLVDLPPPAPPAPTVPAPTVPAPIAPAPAVPAVDASDSVDLDALSDQDLAALYESAVGQHLDETEHVPSEPTAPPAPEAAAAPAATVDLANFTARGNSVATSSAAARRFGRKR